MRPAPVRAFTLIELLVVVAIMALLISILLPSLSRAREQGRVAVCLSNLRSIAGSATQYLLDEARGGGDLPWALPSGFQTEDFKPRRRFRVATEFIWGGGMPDKTREETLQATGYDLTEADVYLIPPRFRAMNPYVLGSVSFDDGRRDGVPDERSRIDIRNDNLPGVFRCPSDRTALTHTISDRNDKTEDDLTFPSWDFWGSSYPINWWWPYYYAGRADRRGDGAPPGNRAPWNERFDRIMGFAWPSNGLGAYMLRRASAGWESRFIIFYENMWNYAASSAWPENSPHVGPESTNYTGWHKQFGYHAGAYRDGHADYRRRDTRFVEGPGWTTWPSRPWEGFWADY